MKRTFLKLLSLGCLTPVLPAWAQLRVEISGVGANQIPIAIGQFWDDPAGENQVSAIIKADLQRSGLFRLVATNELVSETMAVNNGFWKSQGADALAGGTLRRVDGRIEVRYRLHDIAKGTDLAASVLTVNP